MFVVPLKWLPYLFVIVGVYCLITEDQDLGIGGSLVILAIGVVWLCLQYGKKNKSTAAAQTQVPVQTAAVNAAAAPAAQQQSSPVHGAKNFCTRCGTKIAQNDKFCPSCGKALD